MGERVEDNEKVLLAITNNMKKEGTFEELTNWNLGTIASLLFDISKSLAEIADHLDKE